MAVASSAREVERIAVAPAATLAEQLERREQPLLIAGGAAHWPALRTWQPQALEQRLGHAEIEFKLSSCHAHPDFRRTALHEMFARGRASFAEFLRDITSGPECERARRLFTGDEQYLLRRREGVTTIHPVLRPLLDDIELPPAIAPEQLYSVWCWFSGRGVRTWLHYDNNGCHNLNAQVSGHKECWLYAPEQLSRLHPFPLGGANPAHNCSQIDVERPQPELEAELRAAEAWHTELKAGDLLFIPAWWFHTFRHLGGFNANVNFWWKPARPTFNAVAARQALIDLAARAGLSKSADARATLLALDRAACGQSSEGGSAAPGALSPPSC